MPQIVRLLALDQHLAKANLLIVGDGPGVPEIVRQARESGIAERLHVTGVVWRDMLAPSISHFDITLPPEVTPNASPLKLLEYMAPSWAIVAPNAPDILEILTDGTGGLLAGRDPMSRPN